MEGIMTDHATTPTPQQSEALKLMFEAIDKADAMDKNEFQKTTMMSSHITRIKHFADQARGINQ
jgi:hypothetical protein